MDLALSEFWKNGEFGHRGFVCQSIVGIKKVKVAKDYFIKTSVNINKLQNYFIYFLFSTNFLFQSYNLIAKTTEQSFEVPMYLRKQNCITFSDTYLVNIIISNGILFFMPPQPIFSISFSFSLINTG